MASATVGLDEKKFNSSETIMTDPETKKELRNEDPITGEPGSHPVGSGLGAAAGGAIAGAAAGVVGGPIGAAVGAAVGGVAGGLAGKAVAEQIDPTVEARYWESTYKDREYTDSSLEYSHYDPAYRYGWESRGRHDEVDFTKVEGDLERQWADHRGRSQLEWEAARPAAKDAWDRVGNVYGTK